MPPIKYEKKKKKKINVRNYLHLIVSDMCPHLARRPWSPFLCYGNESQFFSNCSSFVWKQQNIQKLKIQKKKPNNNKTIQKSLQKHKKIRNLNKRNREKKTCKKYNWNN